MVEETARAYTLVDGNQECKAINMILLEIYLLAFPLGYA